MFQTGRKCTREEGWGRMRHMPTRTVPKRNHTDPTREGRTPARPGGPSAASATARRTRAHPRGAARETPRHRPRPPMPTGHKCRTFRTAIHEQQPNRHFQPRHKHPRPRIRQQKKYEQNTRKGVPEPQTCRRHHQHSGRSRVDIKHYYINVQRIIRPEDFVISRIGICPSFVFLFLGQHKYPLGRLQHRAHTLDSFPHQIVRQRPSPQFSSRNLNLKCKHPSLPPPLLFGGNRSEH